MRKFKLGVFSLLAAVLVFAVIELLGAYFLHLDTSRRSLASLEILERAGELFGRPSAVQRSERPVAGTALPVNTNPFVSYPTHLGNYRYHPFIDYTGVHIVEDGKIVFPELDFFGFRNDSSAIYFSEPLAERFLVVMTGGSEMAGFSQSRTISTRLEEKLRARLGSRVDSVTVLNMGMNGYVLANEINSFVHLAHGLEPDVVISHSGWNDIVFGSTAPAEFQRLGLNYLGLVIDWLPRLYELKESNLFRWSIKRDGLEDVVPAYLRNLSKYRAIAETAGAEFILGLQGFDLSHNPRYDATTQEIHLLVAELYEEIKEELPASIDMIDFSAIRDLEFYDPVHSLDSAAERIAEIYADRIMQNIAN